MGSGRFYFHSEGKRGKKKAANLGISPAVTAGLKGHRAAPRRHSRRGGGGAGGSAEAAEPVRSQRGRGGARSAAAERSAARPGRRWSGAPRAALPARGAERLRRGAARRGARSLPWNMVRGGGCQGAAPAAPRSWWRRRLAHGARSPRSAAQGGGREQPRRPAGAQRPPAARLPGGDAAAGRPGFAFPMGLPPAAGTFTFCSAGGRGAPRRRPGLRGLSAARRARAAGRPPGEEASPLRHRGGRRGSRAGRRGPAAGGDTPAGPGPGPGARPEERDSGGRRRDPRGAERRGAGRRGCGGAVPCRRGLHRAPATRPVPCARAGREGWTLAVRVERAAHPRGGNP